MIQFRVKMESVKLMAIRLHVNAQMDGEGKPAKSKVKPYLKLSLRIWRLTANEEISNKIKPLAMNISLHTKTLR